ALARKLTEAQRDLAIARGLEETLRGQLRRPNIPPPDRANLLQQLANASGDLTKKQQAVESLQDRLDRLAELRAPRAGSVMGLPEREQVGQLWDKSEQKPFCFVGDPTKLQVLLPVSPADYRQLQDDLAAEHDL